MGMKRGRRGRIIKVGGGTCEEVRRDVKREKSHDL